MAKLGLFLLSLLIVVPCLHAESFKSPSQCVPGKRVVDLRGRTGTITKVHDQTMCNVKFSSGEESLLFWMLHDAGGTAETDDKLVPGVYECFADGHYTFMDMKILSTTTYEAAGTKGNFRVDPSSRQIVFQGGSLAKYHAKLLAGPRIGLNSDGGSFYATTCELRKGKK